MKRATKEATQGLISDLRSIAPKRPLTYGESLQVARIQAARLRRWAGADEPDINLIWLITQRAVPVHFVPSHKLNEESGLTTDQVSGQLEVFINQHEPDLRQRFSLLHEFKHVIDFPGADTLHAKLGRGNRKLQSDMVEWIANEFAAHVLMPTALVKRTWFKLHDLATVANVFNVSVEAMATRLERLNLIGEGRPAPRTYFRRTLITFDLAQVAKA
jgi:hypothetical protein